MPSAPAVLYASCTTERLRELRSKPTVAILGSRVPTRYARQITSELAQHLAAAGITVVSGMNTGLEGTVHQYGNSIAVMPGCPENHFPYENRDLHRYILARSAAISEFALGSFIPKSWCFIASQRIIAALSSVVVVVEVEARSCALFAARIASDLGAEVAVVPGRVTDPGGKWIFELLRDGAHPVSRAQDVLELIGEP